MPLRLGAAAIAAAILATLSVMIIRAVVDPALVPDIGAREAFLFQCIGIGLVAGLVLQVVFRWRGLPGYRGGLAWGAGGFAAAVLAPLWAMPDQPPGTPPLGDGGALLFWLFTIAITAVGLAFLLASRGPRRLFGVALLLAPPLLAPASAWQEQTGAGEIEGLAAPLPGDAGGLPMEPLETATGSDTLLLLGLNLVFWLLLGVFSVLAARRILQR